MRLIPLILGGLILVVPACAKQTCTELLGEDFTLKAEVNEAVEGGPVVFRVTLTFHGKKPVEMFFANPDLDSFAFSTPKGWDRIEPYITDGTSNGWGGGYQTVMPGGQVVKTVYMHEQFKRVPSGPASIKLIWGVNLKGQREREITTQIYLDVPPATPEQLARVRKRMEAKLDRPDLTAAERRGVARSIIGTRHRAFVPVALRLIASPDLPYDVPRLIDFAYCLIEEPNEVHARLVALASEPAWGRQVDLFRYWWSRHEDDPSATDERRADVGALARDPEKAFLVDLIYPYSTSRRTALPAVEFAKLLDAKNTWTKILTYVTFPSRSPQEWTRTLLEECCQLIRPLPARQLACLLRDLDDDSFPVREKASVQLEHFGERVESQLMQALRTDLSPEAKRRVRLILERITTAKEEPEWKPILDYLSSGDCDREAALAVLRALAKGNPDTTLTKAAVESLHKLTASK